MAHTFIRARKANSVGHTCQTLTVSFWDRMIMQEVQFPVTTKTLNINKQEQHFRLSHQRCWEFHYSGMWCCVTGWATYVLKVRDAFISKGQTVTEEFFLDCLTLGDDGNMIHSPSNRMSYPRSLKTWTYVINPLNLAATVHPYIQICCYNSHLSFWMLLLTHKSKYSLCIFVCLLFRWCTTIFSVIGQIWSSSQVTYGITIDDRGTSTSYHCPNTPRFVQDCQLQNSNNFTLQ